MAVQTVIDGTDYTSSTLEGSVTHQHNRPSFASVKMPSHVAPSGQPSRLKVVIGGGLDFHGSLVHIEDQGDENAIYSTFTFADPTLIWEMRPARDADGDFSKPSFIENFVTGPQIVQEILSNSMVSGNPAIGEGPMGITLGSFAGGGANLSGAPTDWPMSIAQVIQLLVETGKLDVVNTPIDSGGNMGSVSAYNGDYGSNLSGSVSFQFATGTHNARACRRTVDLKEIMNKLWIYLGPRIGTSEDPAGDQHWKANITGDDPLLPNPPQSTIAGAVTASRSAYYERMLIRIFDAGENEAVASRELYRRWWQMETWLRYKPRTFVHLTPQRGIAPAFRTGDLIGVAAGSRFRGGFSGTQRVMEYTYRWDANGVVELGEPVGMAGAPAIVTTGDAEGL